MATLAVMQDKHVAFQTMTVAIINVKENKNYLK